MAFQSICQPTSILDLSSGSVVELSNKGTTYESLIYLFPPWNARVVRILQESGHDILIDTNDPSVFILWGKPRTTLQLPGTDIGSQIELSSRRNSWVVTNYVPAIPHHLG